MNPLQTAEEMVLTNRVLLTTQIPSNALVSCIRMRGATAAMARWCLMDCGHGSSNGLSPIVS